MQHDGRITVLEAVGEAGGSTRLAYEGHVLLLRPSDGYRPIHIYLNKIYKGKQPDIPLASGDVVYVPSSVGKDFLVNLPQIMGTLAGSAIYAINVSH
jgi:protein involved in polysaccharide export with SLBB domain